MTERWCLVHAKIHRETTAVEHLTRQGYRAFLPLSWRRIRHARKTSVEKRAFFPGYLFVSLDLEQDSWRAINSTTGVVRLVANGGAPAVAPVGFVEQLIAAADAESVLILQPKLEPGEQVRIVGGAFAEQIAVIESLDGPDRVRVLLDLMEARIPIELPRSQISKP